MPLIISIPDASRPGVEAARESAFVADQIGVESAGESAPGGARVGAQAGILQSPVTIRWRPSETLTCRASDRAHISVEPPAGPASASAEVGDWIVDCATGAELLPCTEHD